MHKLNHFSIVIVIFYVSISYSEIAFNSLREKLVLQLFKVKPKTNLVGSELLVRFPLCKLASIAKGSTKQELMTLLGYRDDAALNNCYSRLKESIKNMAETDLTYIVRIYVNYSESINASFIGNGSEKYGVRVEKVGFNYPHAALDFINRVVGSATFNRVHDILDANDINKNTRMVIISGAHFKGTWENQFDFRLTKLKKFRHIDGKVSLVPMMTKLDEFSSVTDSDCQLLTMRFGSWRASLTILLPKTPQALPQLLEKIQKQPNYIYTMVKSVKTSPMKVFIPRFKIRTFVDWSGFLQGLGLYSIFDNKTAGLSGILKKDYQKNNISLSKVKQKLFVQIDEMGVARYTRDPIILSALMATPKMPIFLNVPEFNADRPFYFQITLDFENARYEMFTGVYYGPEPASLNSI